MRSTRTLDAGAAGGSGASLPRPSPRGQVLDSQLLLSNTTSEAVEHALPEATVHSFLATGAPQEIHVLISGYSDAHARRLVAARGFVEAAR